MRGSITKHLFKALLLVTATIQLVDAQSLDATRAKLHALKSCLADSPSAIDDLTQGLTVGWRHQAGPPWLNGNKSWTVVPPPTAYLDTLDRDLAACKTAAQTKDDSQRQTILKSVVKDIEIKALDCRRSGMGRAVAVRVTTVQVTTPDNGWEVFYKWETVSSFTVDEMRIPGLSSPALADLPPGEYTFRAQKKNEIGALRKTDPVTIIVGIGAPVIECQLPIQ